MRSDPWSSWKHCIYWLRTHLHPQLEFEAQLYETSDFQQVTSLQATQGCAAHTLP